MFGLWHTSGKQLSYKLGLNVALIAGELHHEFCLHRETLFEKVISMQHMFLFCFALILIVSNITVPERMAKYISVGCCKKYTVTEHKWLFAYK